MSHWTLRLDSFVSSFSLVRDAVRHWALDRLLSRPMKAVVSEEEGEELCQFHGCDSRATARVSVAATDGTMYLTPIYRDSVPGIIDVSVCDYHAGQLFSARLESVKPKSTAVLRLIKGHAASPPRGE